MAMTGRCLAGWRVAGKFYDSIEPERALGEGASIPVGLRRTKASMFWRIGGHFPKENRLSADGSATDRL